MAADTESVFSCVACCGPLSFFGRTQGYEYQRCTACGTLQLIPPPSREDLDRAYASEYATANHISPDPAQYYELSRTYCSAALRVLKDYGVQGRIAEVGAGWGGLSQLLLANGFEYDGVEPSEQMASYCRNQGLPVVRGDIMALPGHGYAALVLTNVFEHLVEHEHWLSHANEILQPGGLFVTAQPTAHFARLAAQVFRLGRLNAPLPQLHQEFCPPWHAVLFSLKGMEQLAARHGFELISIRPMPQGRDPGLTGILQRILERVNNLGWLVLRVRWPLVIGHIFIFRKICAQA